MKFGFTLGLLITVISTNNAVATEQISNNKTITSVHSYLGGATFKYTPSSSDNFGCTGVAAARAVHIDWSADDNYKAMYSLALAAYSAGKTVGFGVDGCVSGNGGLIPKVYRVDVN